MNLLILSVGTRNKIVQYFKNAIGSDGKIVCADMSELTPALYEADAYYKIPGIKDEKYLDTVLDICKREKIDAALSLIDPELSILSKNEESFSELGVKLICSSYELCERALNKMQMYNWLCEHGYHCAKSFDNTEDFYSALNAGEISFPVFVKPICGSASDSIFKVSDKEELEFLFARKNGLMIQEYLKGYEIGADVYVDMISKEVVSIFTKKKILMRAGETDKSVSFKDEKLFELVERFSEESGWVGELDIDIINVDGEYYISEVNPRFGGGYPHAYECGCDHMTMIKNNIEGRANEKNIGNYEENVYMMKYVGVLVKSL